MVAGSSYVYIVQAVKQGHVQRKQHNYCCLYVCMSVCVCLRACLLVCAVRFLDKINFIVQTRVLLVLVLVEAGVGNSQVTKNQVFTV